MSWSYQILERAVVAEGYLPRQSFHSNERRVLAARHVDGALVCVRYVSLGHWSFEYVSGDTTIPLKVDVPREDHDPGAAFTRFGPRCLVRLDIHQSIACSLGEDFDPSAFSDCICSFLGEFHACRDLMPRPPSPRMQIVEFEDQFADELQIEKRVVLLDDEVAPSSFEDLELGGQHKPRFGEKHEMTWLYRPVEDPVACRPPTSADEPPSPLSTWFFAHPTSGVIMTALDTRGGLNISYYFRKNAVHVFLLPTVEHDPSRPDGIRREYGPAPTAVICTNHRQPDRFHVSADFDAAFYSAHLRELVRELNEGKSFLTSRAEMKITELDLHPKVYPPSFLPASRENLKLQE
ncbi:MAG: hypothetical protein AAF441_19485 [Pseudomonadota bacterium]